MYCTPAETHAPIVNLPMIRAPVVVTAIIAVCLLSGFPRVSQRESFPGLGLRMPRCVFPIHFALPQLFSSAPLPAVFFVDGLVAGRRTCVCLIIFLAQCFPFLPLMMLGSRVAKSLRFPFALLPRNTSSMTLMFRHAVVHFIRAIADVGNYLLGPCTVFHDVQVLRRHWQCVFPLLGISALAEASFAEPSTGQSLALGALAA